MTKDPNILAIQQLLDDGYLVTIAHTTNEERYKPGKITGWGIFSRLEQKRALQVLVNRELCKIPKWVRRMFKVKLL